MRTFYFLMAGGSGKRLWPSSRRFYPKPLLSLKEDLSLLGSAIKLLSSRDASPEIQVLLGAPHEEVFRSHLDGMDLGGARISIMPEPLSRNTAPAIALGVMRVMSELREGEDAIFVVSPSDHLISESDLFWKALKTAIAAAKKGFIATVGVKPTYPDTGYGYIQKGENLPECGGDVFTIKRFTEKPDLQMAQKYVKNSFLWNCGIFVFRGRVMMEQLKQHVPQVFSAVRKSLSKEDASGVPDAKSYARAPDISIDFAVMERTDLGAVVPAGFIWSDIGSWEAVYKSSRKGKGGNVATGDAVLEDCENCLVRSAGGRLVVANGLKEIAIVDEGDALLVSDINRSGEIKTVVDGLIRSGRTEAVRPARLERVWGSEKFLEKEPGFSVKNIRVLEKMEYAPQVSGGHMVILEGDARATLGNKSVTLSSGDLLEIPGDVPLRVKNGGKSPLRLLQISFENKEQD